MKQRLALFASLVAALLVLLAGWELWRPTSARVPVHVVTVAWRCERTGDACAAVVETERCTTCHAMPHALGRHQDVGCVACHGGDGTSASTVGAHTGLASLGRHGDPPVVEARCALCHEGDPAPLQPSPAREAWRRWTATQQGKPAPAPAPAKEASFGAAVLVRGRASFAALRCGACHAARDTSPAATPLDTLALRSSAAQLVAALEEHGARAYDPHLDAAAAGAVAAYLRSIEPAEAATAMLHRASIAGSSAAEGRVLATRLQCVACHADVASDARLRTADWLAYYLLDPHRANAASRMPSLHLSTREAASLAQAIMPAASPATPGQPERGEALVKAGRCEACHTTTLAPGGPSLVQWGDDHDAQATLGKLAAHAGYALSKEDQRALATYLESQRSTHVRPDLHVAAPPGAQTYASSECAGCHVEGDPSKPLSLYGEGLRVLPQWLFEYLRAPERHPVRPPYHPEEAYRDLVPADRVAVRMPTYDFDDATRADLVSFFATRDGAALPFASNAVAPGALAGDALATAIGDLTRKDRGGCLSCHTIASPDPLRAREDGDKLAPPLSLAHERLRAEWIEACVAEPEKWVAGMPAFVRPTPEIERVRDLILMLRERTVLPPAGSEAVIPALGLGDAP